MQSLHFGTALFLRLAFLRLALALRSQRFLQFKKWRNKKCTRKRFVDSHGYLGEYDNTDFFAWHHVLTGSCKAGRDAFVKDHGIDMTGKTTTKDFLELTADSYGSDIIRAIIKAYTEA